MAPRLHTGPSEHILADADEWQDLAGAQGPLPGGRPRRFHEPRVGGQGLCPSTEGGGVPRYGQEEHVPRFAGLPAPRTKSVPSGPAALALGTERRERGGQGLRAVPTQLQTPTWLPTEPPPDPCAHSPLWLTQVGFRSFIVRPPG